MDSSVLAPTSIATPGATASVGYDRAGRISASTSPYGALTVYTYDPNNISLITATTGTRIVKTTMDGLGRAIRVETGDATSVQSIVDTEYDSCACSPIGKIKRVSQPYAPAGTVYWTTYTYDALGRTVRVDLPDNSGYITTVYEGNTTTATDPAGKLKKYTHDALGRFTRSLSRRRKAAPTSPPISTICWARWGRPGCRAPSTARWSPRSAPSTMTW